MDHEQQTALPDRLETGARHGPRAAGRITDQHAALVQPLDHDKMPVALLGHQHDGGKARLSQLIQRQLKPVGQKATTGKKTLDIKQGKSLFAYLLLITLLVHLLKNKLFRHWIGIMMGQQGGHRGGTATEVVLLVQGALETRFAHAHQRHLEARAKGTDIGRAGAWGCHAAQQGQA